MGEPCRHVIRFFGQYATPAARVLDMGCGQGRDALFIARLGHSVTGVDLSAKGIADMLAEARRENLPVSGVVADLTIWQPIGQFDIILFDRVLHMLDAPDRLAVLGTGIDALAAGGHILISDEKPSLPALRDLMGQSARKFDTVFRDNSRLFVRCRND